jgi:peptide/nickel transport system permease protein
MFKLIKKLNVTGITAGEEPFTAKEEELGRKRVTFHGRIFKSMVKAKTPLIAAVIIFIVILMAAFAPFFAPNEPNSVDIRNRILPPAFMENGNAEYPLGTDTMGRCVLSRLIYGARVSIVVGIAAVIVAGVLGTMLGIIAGYFGGIVDDIIMRLADIQLAFPFILLTISVLAVIQATRDVHQIEVNLIQRLLPLILTLGVAQWVVYARLARGEALSMREKEFVDAARALGDNHFSIMFRNILPNAIAPLIVIASFNVGSSIIAESSLSFLGLGVPPSIPTWGGMLAESRELLITGNLWLSTLPGLCIVLTVLSINIIGDWLRDFLDPRLRT